MNLPTRFAVIDLETTGIEVGQHRVIECAVVELDMEGLETDSWSTLINPPGDDEIGASEIHGITRTMTFGAPEFSDIIGELVDRLRDRVLVGHVLAFDLGHLAAEFARAGFSLPSLGAGGLCTRELVKAYLPEGTRSLGSCCEHFGVFYDGAHRALNDARATAALFGVLRRRLGEVGVSAASVAARSVTWPVLEAAWPSIEPLEVLPVPG